MAHELKVGCDPHDAGWRCTVVVGTDASATEHVVDVDRLTLDDLAPGSTPDELVRESFAYLLEREPRESIMRSFELPIISRFFGDYPDEISRRMRGG
ncbi:MAG: hypothetical protein M3153_03290 [Chloroflexota bacterium]|nr:hypothetical protein [Chloroflexota bacterium]